MVSCVLSVGIISAQQSRLFLLLMSSHCLLIALAILWIVCPLAATAFAVRIMSVLSFRSPFPRANSAICVICSDIFFPTLTMGLLSSENSSVSSRRDCAARCKRGREEGARERGGEGGEEREERRGRGEGGREGGREGEEREGGKEGEMRGREGGGDEREGRRGDEREGRRGR